MSMVSHKSVSLVLSTGDPVDFSQLAKKESMDNVERWINSIQHTVRMIDFHQQEYRMLHDRHMRSKSHPLFLFSNTLSYKPIAIVTKRIETDRGRGFYNSGILNKPTGKMVVFFRMFGSYGCFCCPSHVYQKNVQQGQSWSETDGLNLYVIRTL